jgi:hypothetical protein
MLETSKITQHGLENNRGNAVLSYERGPHMVSALAFPIRNGRFPGSTTSFSDFNFSLSSTIPHYSTLTIAWCIFPSSMQLDIDDWTFTRVVLTAVGVGIISGLVFCTAAAYLLPDVEERWEESTG